MTFKKIFNGRALYVHNNVIWVANGLYFFGIDFNGKCISSKYKIGSTFERFISAFRLSRQLLRVGIHHLIPLVDGGFLVVLKKKVIKVSINCSIENIFIAFKGNKPAHRGMCVTPAGTVFFGEYTLNMDRKNTSSLFRSNDNGKTFKCIKTFQGDEIRHIHFIQWDVYGKCLWLGTGDRDAESKLFRSYDNGDSFELVGEGNQLWRAVGVSFTVDALFWGTDAGSDAGDHQNYIIRMDRRTLKIEKIRMVEGPCHGNAVLADGTVYVSTGIEGGKNEKDCYAHIWKCEKSGTVKEILKFKKDIYPNIVQYGVVRFPMGLEGSNTIIYTTYALKGNGEAVYINE